MPPMTHDTESPTSDYESKPFLRLLEFYVLKAIDELPDSDRKKLELLEPKLQSVYRATGTWDQVIAKVMKFDQQMPAMIRATWIKNREASNKAGSLLSSQEFARVFAKLNLAAGQESR